MSNKDRHSDELHPDQAYMIENFDGDEHERKKRALLYMALLELCMHNGGHIKILIRPTPPEWANIPLDNLCMDAQITKEAYHFRLRKR